MGSLVSGWDTNAPGKPPKGFEDYAEPMTPRSAARTLHSPFKEAPHGSAKQPQGPPGLARMSAPPAVHNASAMQRYLTRASSGRQSPPSSPRGSGTPRAPPKHMTLMIGDGDEAGLNGKEKWCSRVSSAKLNEMPDEGDEKVWRRGTFKLADVAHATHYPATPPSVVAAAPSATAEPRVTVTRLPQEVIDSFESAGL